MTSDDGGDTSRECAGCGIQFLPASPGQNYHSTACRKETRAKQQAAEETAVQWSVVHGAPVRMLEGWDPDNGIWADGSPMAEVIGMVGRGVHVNVAGRKHGFRDIADLLYKGAEYVSSENRMLIPIEVRPLTDLVSEIDWAEAGGESDLAMHAYDVALADRTNPKHALDFLARRWPTRWREQQQVTTIAEDDPRERAVTELLSDPANAVKLAELADQVENSVEDAERADGNG